MARSETVWRTLGRAHVMAANDMTPLVVLTTQLPRAGTEPDRALRAARVRAPSSTPWTCSRPRRASAWPPTPGDGHRAPLPGFWSTADLAPGAV